MTHSKAPLAYRAASLETAACLWEAVLSMSSDEDAFMRSAEENERYRQINAAREALGSAQLRLTVIGWTDLVDAAWIDADGCDDMGNGGQYGAPFDWEFVPGWIIANIDWSNPHAPTVRPSKHTAPRGYDALLGDAAKKGGWA